MVVPHRGIVVGVSGSDLGDSDVVCEVAVSGDLGAFEGVRIGSYRGDACFDADGFTETEYLIVSDDSSFISVLDIDEQIPFVFWVLCSYPLSYFQPVSECLFNHIVGE